VIICSRCGKENQDQHKFCLRCGAELAAAAAPPAPPPAAAPHTGQEAMAKTMMADPSQRPGGTASQPAQGAPFGGAPFIAPTPFTPPGAAAGPGLPGMPPATPGAPPLKPKSGPGVGLPPPLSVTGAASAQPPPASPFGAPPSPFGAPPSPFGAPAAPAASPFGAPAPAAPPAAASPFGAPAPAASPFAAPPPPAGFGGVQPVAPATAATTPVACPSCGSAVPPGFKFCGVCGHKLEVPPPVAAPAVAAVAPVAAPVAAPQPRGRLTLIRPDGSEGGTFDLADGVNRLGRIAGAIFENDGYLSPDHAELTIATQGSLVKDLGSLNGVFVKMTAEEEIQPTDVFRIGQELMRFDTIAPPAPLEDGTEIMGSPNPGYWGRISVIIGKDIDGSAFPLLGDAVTLGRERGDINFPDDGYVSGLHARLSTRNGRFYLADLGSSNGTFIKIRGERTLENGSFVLLGQQLFRVNY
jgi:hypothetical protein